MLAKKDTRILSLELWVILGYLGPFLEYFLDFLDMSECIWVQNDFWTKIYILPQCDKSSFEEKTSLTGVYISGTLYMPYTRNM